MANKKGNCIERRKDILDYLNMTGTFGISKIIIKGLSEKFQVSERQIYKDIEIVIQKVTMPKIEILSKKFILSLESNMRAAHKLIFSKDQNIQAKGISLLNQTISNFTNFLEKFGLKKVVPDLVETLEQSISKDTFEIYQELTEKYIKSFDKRNENEMKLKEILKNKLGEKLFEETLKEIEEKIYSAKEIFQILPIRNKDGIIERIIYMQVASNEEIREERERKFIEMQNKKKAFNSIE